MVHLSTKAASGEKSNVQDETSDLVQALLVVDEAISKSQGETHRRILHSYTEAQVYAAGLRSKNAKPSARVKACFTRYRAYKEADDVAAIGWLLVAAYERIAQKNLPAWQMLEALADHAAKKLAAGHRTLN